MFNFDGQSRIISLDLGVIEFETIDLYSSWKEWVSIGENAKYSKAFNVVGGEPINTTGTKVISPYFFLTNNWKIRPQEADHQLDINGNLLVDDGSNSTVATLGDFDVFIRTNLSVNSVTTFGSVSETALHTALDSYMNKSLWKDMNTEELKNWITAMNFSS